MRTCIKGIAPEWYTLKIDENEPEPVRFHLKPLDGLSWTAVLMDSYDPGRGEVNGTGIIEAFKLGVKGWEHIEDADNPGQPLAFSMAAMARIPPGWIMEVGKRVLEISQLSSEAIKNSDSPSS